jgi:hypothetical protein
MLKAMSELFRKNHSPLTQLLSRCNVPLLESSIGLPPWRLDCHRWIRTSFPIQLMRTTTTGRRRWRTRSPSTLHDHHHDGSSAMINRCTKSFHALRIDQIGKVCEVTLIVGCDRAIAETAKCESKIQ